MSTFDDVVRERVKAAVQPRLSDLIDSHCEQRSRYRDARLCVALGEMEGAYTPDEVDRLELALANVYEMLHDNAESLAAISVELEFGNG